jgi:hypothetical protein
MRETSGDEVDNVTGYILENGDDVGFTRFFWKGCEPLPRDLENYSKFASITKGFARGIEPKRMDMGVGLGSAHSWARQDAMPKLGHYLKAFLELGLPTEGRLWLTLECTHGYANPIGQFVQVPTKIESWRDVQGVLTQITPLGEGTTKFSREYLFGFFVGMIIGDAHKPKQGRGHRHVSITLSKKYDTNVAIGDFSSFSAHQFGLRMERRPDLPKPEDKPHGFYVWTSQSSPLIDWIFNVVLGLNDDQHTTYDAVRMDWALEAPIDFRLGLLHGIAESDGSVNVASQEVEFWVIPDWDFMIKLLATFGLRGFRNREAVTLSKSQAINSFRVPVFSPHLRTARYQSHELMATTPTLERRDRLPEDVRADIMRLAKEGMSVPRIVVEIARTKKLLVSFEAAQRWAKKSGAYAPKSSNERRKKDPE